MKRTVAEHLVDTLACAGVRQIYGVVGDSLNPVTDALRRSGTIKWIDVRHEESGADHCLVLPGVGDQVLDRFHARVRILAAGKQLYHA